MSSLRRAFLVLLLRRCAANDLDEEDLFDLDGEGDYEDPESYIEYDQALYYDGPDDYYDGIEQFNMEDMADYPGEVSPELLEKIFGENPRGKIQRKNSKKKNPLANCSGKLSRGGGRKKQGLRSNTRYRGYVSRPGDFLHPLFYPT